MDPLSVIASVIALCQAGERTAGLIATLQKLKVAPKEVQALTEEIAKFNSVLKAVLTSLVRVQSSDIWSSGEAHELVSVVDAIREQVTSLDEILHFTLLDPSGSVRRMRWLTNKTKVDAIRHRLSAEILRANLCLTELNISAQVNVTTKLDAIFAASMVIQSEQGIQRRMFELNLTDQRKMLQQFAVDVITSTVPSTSSEPTNVNGHEPLFLESSNANADDSNFSPTADSVHVETNALTKLRTLRCTPACDCRCHKRASDVVLHGFLQTTQALLRAFIQNQNPSNRGRNLSTCQQHTLPSYTISASLTSLFLRRYILLTVSQQPLSSVKISFPRLVSPYANVIKYVEAGDCENVHKLFQGCLASPHDINAQSGSSLLSLAVMNLQTDMCRLLMNWGADPFLPNLTVMAEMPVQLCFILDKVSTSPFPDADRNTASQILSVLPKASADDMDFSPLHELAYMGNASLLHDMLESGSHHVSDRDCFGKTALHLATFMGDASKTKLLLQYGADANAVDKAGQTPLHTCIHGNTAACIDLLLSYGSNPDAQDNWGCTTLHKMCENPDLHGEPDKLLLNSANVNMVDMDGYSILSTAVAGKHVNAIKPLLDRNADIDHQDNKGLTSLLLAVMSNSHRCLEVLLDSGACYTKANKNGDSILHFAALYAESEVLELLLMYEMPLLSIHTENKDGDTPRELFERCITQEKEHGAEMEEMDEIAELFHELLVHTEIVHESARHKYETLPRSAIRIANKARLQELPSDTDDDHGDHHVDHNDEDDHSGEEDLFYDVTEAPTPKIEV